MSSLDPHQLAAAESTAPVTIVSANPGAGKTRTLCAAILTTISRGASPKDIVCLTFTNAGANELADRLGHIKLGFLGTLHGYCFRLLQRFGKILGYRHGSINLIDEKTSEELLRDVAKRFRYKGSDKALFAGRDPQAQLCWKEYHFTLKKNNLVDYDGVLREAIELLGTPVQGESWGLPKFLFVDEAQDSALADWEIYDLLKAAYVFIVGDTDQSIFAFRGAHPSGFIERWNQGSSASCYTLSTNYRSCVSVCATATKLISNNVNRIPKNVEPWRRDEGETLYTLHRNDAAERGSVCLQIQEKHQAYSYSDIAILCRTNRLCEEFRQVLEQNGIPMHTSGAADLPADFRHCVDVLSLIADPYNDIIAEKVAKESESPKKIADGKRTASTEGISLAHVLWGLCPADTFGYDNDPASLISALPLWNVDMETCELIAERIKQLPMPNPTLTDLRHDLFNHDKWAKTDGDSHGVTVCTIHSAKGREFPIVFLPAWEQGVLPSLRADADLEEERRLAFVAITRAADECHISSVSQRRQNWGGVKESQPSIFIKEAGLLV
jgi:DNA helicase-2/ATP-dependent DNA helicase PcrA